MANEGGPHSMAAEGGPHIDGVPGEGELRGNDAEGDRPDRSRSPARAALGAPGAALGAPGAVLEPLEPRWKSLEYQLQKAVMWRFLQTLRKSLRIPLGIPRFR